MCEPQNCDNGASDLWTLTAYIVSQDHFMHLYTVLFASLKFIGTDEGQKTIENQEKGPYM